MRRLELDAPKDACAISPAILCISFLFLSLLFVAASFVSQSIVAEP